MRSHAVIAAFLISGMVASALPAFGQSVPLPTPSPQSRQRHAVPTAGQPGRPSAAVPAAPATPAQQPSDGITNWLPQIFGGRPNSGSAGNFDPAQRALADKVSAYLSSIQVLSGNFVQRGPDGRQSKGQFYIQKPGRVRFEYDPPNPIEIVADGSSVVVKDRNLGTQDPYPLSQTPLRYLLAERLDLLRDTNVTGIYADQTYVTVVIEERQALLGTSRLMMMFDARDLKLKQWTITDPQGYDTTVAVSNLDSTHRPDPNMFRIDYTRYPN